MVANIMFWRMRICFFCQRGDTALVLTLQLLGSVDGLLVGRRDGEDGAWHHALLPAAAHYAPLDAFAVVQHRAALALVDAHFHLLVDAGGRDGGRLPQRLLRCLSGTTVLERFMSSCMVALNWLSSSRMSCISLRSCSPSPRLKFVLLYVLFSFSSWLRRIS